MSFILVSSTKSWVVVCVVVCVLVVLDVDVVVLDVVVVVLDVDVVIPVLLVDDVVGGLTDFCNGNENGIDIRDKKSIVIPTVCHVSGDCYTVLSDKSSISR